MADLIGFEMFKRQILGGSFDGYPVLAECRLELTCGVDMILLCKLASTGSDGDIRYIDLEFGGVIVPGDVEEQIFIYKTNFVNVQTQYYSTINLEIKQDEFNKRLNLIKTDFITRLQNMDDGTEEKTAFVARQLENVSIQ